MQLLRIIKGIAPRAITDGFINFCRGRTFFDSKKRGNKLYKGTIMYPIGYPETSRLSFVYQSNNLELGRLKSSLIEAWRQLQTFIDVINAQGLVIDCTV